MHPSGRDLVSLTKHLFYYDKFVVGMFYGILTKKRRFCENGLVRDAVNLTA